VLVKPLTQHIDRRFMKQPTKGNTMKTLSHNVTKLILITALASPIALLAAEQSTEAHDSHHPDKIPVKAAPAKPAPFSQIQERMHARMLAMQNTADPAARQTMMMAQMQDMTTMMTTMGTGCPMATQGKGAQGMMGESHAGMMGHMMGGEQPK
jgi:hypothetical protein